MPMETLLRPGGHACACGQHHETTLKRLAMGSGVIAEVCAVLAGLGHRHPFVVCDSNTYAVAGERVLALLEASGMAYSRFVFPPSGTKIEPDERAVGALTMAFDPRCDVVLAVGSGVINDCCRVLGHATGLPFIVVATAPSMDGYASSSSSMLQNSIKVSLPGRCPEAIIADIDIIKEAPTRMLWAGLGDMLAKYIALCEWRIAHTVTGEFYCEEIAQLVRHALKKCVDQADMLMSRNAQAVASVMEGLVLSGVAMSFAGASRPASGIEHYFSHLWEMFDLQRHLPSDLHGVQVGVGTALSLGLYAWLRQETPDIGTARQAYAGFSQAQWAQRMCEIFGSAAASIIDNEQAVYHKNSPSRAQAHIDTIVAQWPAILRIMEEELPDCAMIVSLMESVGMPVRPAELNVSPQDVRNALIGSREIRDKYILSSLLWDMGLLDTYAQRLLEALS